MSPVSRGRKNKKKSGRAPRPRSYASLAKAASERPKWFDPTIDAVLGEAAKLMSAQGSREHEQVTAELVGVALHGVLDAGEVGLRFFQWFGELVDAARRQQANRLLYGLASIGMPEHAEMCRDALRGVEAGPAWLDDLLHVSATGEVARMRDGYGTRFGVIAGFSHADNPFVYLFDVDTSESARLVSAGVFDDVDQAAAAWRADVGDAADGATPRPAGAQELLCLSHLAIGDDHVFGDESRVVMDNWFRAQRRIHDLGDLVSSVRSLYVDFDTTSMVAEFTAWYEDRRGAEPEPDAVASLAEQWMEGALPETWYSVSPSRVAVQRELLGDWIPDDPVTLVAKSVLPDWAAWLSARSNLPEHLRERVAIAAR